GAGTGIVTLFAALTAQRVVCTDINPYAVELIEKNIAINKKQLNTIPQVRLGSLFSPIAPAEKFDVIAFNPPYLPVDQQNSHERNPPSEFWLKRSWQGGEKGIEIISSFLKQVGNHLSSNGMIYLITSSVSGIQKVISRARSSKIHLEVSASLKFPFETLSLLSGGKK
ncbi:MAG: HemK2/MTQ2 family protein methyltransferase, partial [Candidatus Ranarchaeia archaeon]